MLRNILAAIAGYIAMAAVLFALFSLLWLALGPSRSFQPGTWEVSGAWALGSVVLGLVAALMPVEMAAGPRPDDVSMMEATAGARQPAWISWLNPLIGAVGVWFGSRKLRA
ncbi:hypothetical protein [Candidatus Palauibacter sp.]|uniref:hypothetical protein n=1 Tax=Candidatus Palauibacter sp. TaxID=3101350 RepID=UPI003B51C83F